MSKIGDILQALSEMAMARGKYEDKVSGEAPRCFEHLVKLLAFQPNDSTNKWLASLAGTFRIVSADTRFKKKPQDIKKWLKDKLYTEEQVEDVRFITRATAKFQDFKDEHRTDKVILDIADAVLDELIQKAMDKPLTTREILKVLQDKSNGK